MITRNTLRTCEGNQVFSEEEKIRFVTALDLNKCLSQIRKQISLRTCAPISELPSNVSSMILSKGSRKKITVVLSGPAFKVSGHKFFCQNFF